MPIIKKTILTSCLALIAFAANSVLCRLALGNAGIDPAGFTGVRLLSGAITLSFIVLFFTDTNKLSLPRIFSFANTKGWFASAMLFFYAAFFSFAYVKLNTATGALILFASVQFSMIGVMLCKGHRLHLIEWLGVFISFAGFILLMLPSATQPAFSGFILMVIAGVSWAFYTLVGRDVEDPILVTSENFIRCIPIAFVFLLVSLLTYSISWQGFFYAITSGSVASGVGYSLWYLALKNLSITQAAISQLSVPLIAALGGIVFINEALTYELVISGGLILIGILVVSLKKNPDDGRDISNSNENLSNKNR
ncbi:MAG: DMT family transporter [Alteromonadaceae bacterium]